MKMMRLEGGLDGGGEGHRGGRHGRIGVRSRVQVVRPLHLVWRY
jgi:hypothetical protein